MLKKMCPNKFSTPNYTGVKSCKTTGNMVAMAIGHTPPEIRQSKGCFYVEFYAFDPERGVMRRKRIKTNRAKTVSKKRQQARDVLNRISEQLARGWNPWIARDTEELIPFEDAICRYENHIEKMLSNGYFRKETYDGYKSNIKILREYIAKYRNIYYAYQFDRKFCVDFLDYVFIDRNNCAQTRNNYLNFLRVFSGFLLEKCYLKYKPTDGISPISKRLYKKERECIPREVIREIARYCSSHDPHFMFACYLLYYCFIRPIEMTRLRVRDFNLHSGTVTLRGDISKNRTTQTITLPHKVIMYGIEIGVFSAPPGDYLFSDGLRPGTRAIDTKIFRDHWEKVRVALKLKKSWKFYSLKDTGITEMCDSNSIVPRAIKDQARHSSLAITDIYLEKSQSMKASEEISRYNGSL